MKYSLTIVLVQATGKLRMVVFSTTTLLHKLNSGKLRRANERYDKAVEAYETTVNLVVKRQG